MVSPVGLDLPADFMARSVAPALTLAFCIKVFLAVDRHSHSASDTLYGIFPFVVPALLVLIWIASKSSEDDTV